MSEIQEKLKKAGVFKGFDGLENFANADEFWEEQPYGTRFYFGSGAADYLHRGVLRTAISLLNEDMSESLNQARENELRCAQELDEKAAQIRSLQATLAKIDATNGNNDIAIRIRLAKRVLELEQENQILIEELEEARLEHGRFGVGA